MTAEVRRGIVLALAGLLGGFAMVVALFGTGELLKRSTAGGSSAEAPSAGSETGIPLAALTPPPQGKTPGLETGPGASPDRKTAEAEGTPAFDIVRVEPGGASVVAGRTAPNAKVELLRDGKPYASATSDASGQFALTPPDLPPGSSEIALRAVAPDGKALPGRESVTVVVSEKRDAKPLIALSAPDAPTRVLSQPDAPEAGAGRPATAFAETPGKASPDAKATDPGKPADAGKPAERREAARTGANRAESGGGATGGGGRTPDAGASPRREAARPAESARDKPASGAAAQAGREAAPRIVSVDAQDGGRLDVTAQAPADSTLRLYLNDTLVASGRPGPDGRIAFTIGRGVRAGGYQIRIDSVDPAGGRVRRRAEVSFTYPESASARVAAAEKPAAEAGGARRAAEGRPTDHKAADHKAADHKAADHKPAEGAAVPSSPKAPAPSAAEPKPGQAASRPDAKPAAPKMAESTTQERRLGGTGAAEARGGASRPEGSSAAEPRPGASPTGQTQAPAQRPDQRPPDGAAGPTSPSAPAPARASPSQASPETRPAPSLAGDPAAVPPPAAPGTVTPGTPSVAAGGGVGAPKSAAAAAAALSPKLPESAALPEAGRTAEMSESGAGTVFVPEISTARITRGDSLWQISRRIYGKGNRYTVIYDANQEQIRDPDLIYPGQIFVLPKDAPAAADNPSPKRT